MCGLQVQLYEAYQSSQLVLELVAQGDLLEHINAALDHLCHPGLEEKEVLGLFWQLVSAMAHYHSVGVAYQRGRHLGRSCAHRHREAHLSPSQPYLLPPLSHAGT